MKFEITHEDILNYNLVTVDIASSEYTGAEKTFPALLSTCIKDVYKYENGVSFTLDLYGANYEAQYKHVENLLKALSTVLMLT